MERAFKEQLAKLLGETPFPAAIAFNGGRQALHPAG